MGQIIHHCTDRTMCIKGVGNIGHYFLNPVFDELQHRAIHALGHDRKPFEKKRFERVCDHYKGMIGPLPLPEGVYDAIMSFHK